MREELTSNNKTILVIEDDVPTLRLLVDILIKEGFGVFKAKDGKSGLELALKSHPDLILLDIITPKLDGIRVLRKLRNDNWGKNVPVIILTNLASVQKTAEALDNNVFDYLLKTNYKLEEILKKIKEKLRVK